MINEIDIRKTFEIIKQGDFTEVRIIGNGKTHSGYFANVDTLLKELKKFDSENVYFVLNSINPACYDRKQQECFQSFQIEATKDKDIVHRDWMLIDIDSKRAAAVGATENEKEYARIVGRSVLKFLKNAGFCDPVSCDSGNGIHLLFRISLENTPDNSFLICNVLKLLDTYFSTNEAAVDTVVYNASRITKLYGTVARKGKNSKDRPHRVSKFLSIPNPINTTPLELLRKVADMLPRPEVNTKQNNYNAEKFDLDDFIRKHNINVAKEENFSGGKKYILMQCLFDDGHKGKDAAIFKLDSGALGYKCFHNSCSGYSWTDVRLKFEPDAYESTQKEYSNNRSVQTQQLHQPQRKQQAETKEKGRKFKNLSEIKSQDRSNITTIKSGFNALDKRIIGFNICEVSVWSGSNSSGKSSILNQICINAAQRGFNSIIYSAELDASRLKYWLHLQAAGRQFVNPTEYENSFSVPNHIRKSIDKWLEGKIFVYNNEYGSNLLTLLADIKEHISKHKTDMIVVDNVMTLDTDNLSSDKLEQQKKMMKQLVDFALASNVHIHVVAHPRKSIAFLRKEDISGSSNLTDFAYNVFIVHRVTNDFIKRSKEYFGEATAARWQTFSNVIEVCKNRDLGVMDEMFGLYYEIESKRFLNEPFENPVYDWQNEAFSFRETKTRDITEPKQFDWDDTTQPDQPPPF